MFEFTDVQPQVEVQEAEFRRLLGLPRERPLEGRVQELAEWAPAWYSKHGRPWIFAQAAGGVTFAPGRLSIAGIDFPSARLQAPFAAAEAHDAMLLAVSAGPECEEHARICWQEERPDEYFFLEAYGSAVVESLVTQAAGRICAWADQHGLGVLPHYSPGYPGWPISDQLKLWHLLGSHNGSPFPGQLEVMETGMLRPKKSLLAVFGVTKHPEKVRPGSRLIPCENCSLPRCQYRRAPYRFFMPQAESIGRNQELASEIQSDALLASGGLDLNARYTVNPRALKKWVEERLLLEFANDGSVTARFRYDGTTCSNLGQPLQYNYLVRLEPPSQAYRVAELRCAPASTDTGHAQMCEYLKDAAGLMNRIASEKPLLGRPLNDVLTWERATNPAGCYCEAASREHKWGLVFEVIHFALAQTQRVGSNGQHALPVESSNSAIPL
jgi:hypothetical protein